MNEDDEVDFDAVDSELDSRHDELIEMNAEMVKRAHRKARKMLDTANKFDEMAANCREIAALHVLTARQLSERAADLIDAEFDVQIYEMGIPQEDEDE